MRLTIERIRTLVLATGVLLIVVLVGFLAIGKWKNPFSRRDIPKRLGIDIQQEANGVTYTQAHGGHTIFKIHASRVVQLKNEHATLHDVHIEIYGRNGNSLDRIQGAEFDYDQKSGIATAAGTVEITLTRPPAKAGGDKAAGSADEIQVHTSGLVFNQQTGIASTDQQVNFSSREVSGSAIGASYDSDNNSLVLGRAVELTSMRGPDPVELHARHAEFDRDDQVGHLQDATAQTRGRQVSAGVALIHFRNDGSIEQVNATDGIKVATDTGSRMSAPRGDLDFNQRNQPLKGRFEGGVTLDSASDGRQMHGTAPVMTVAFNAAGVLHHAHLEGGVEMHSRQLGATLEKGRAAPASVTRTWRSQVADVNFRNAGKGQVEPALIYGTGSVVLTAETRRGNQAPVSSRMAADEVTGQFGPNASLVSMTGTGHANLDETTATGVRQTASGDHLQASFVPPSNASGKAASSQAEQVQSAELEGDVTLVQQPAAKPGANAEPPLRVTAGRAIYEAAGQWLHLTVHPHIRNGGMDLTATRVDVSQQSGDAFAHGDVKATWTEDAGASASGGGHRVALGGKGPVHAVAAEAQLHQPTGEATLRGHARLWQQDNSITAPLIVINRQQQTLSARATSFAEPVIAVLLNAGSEPAARLARSRAATPSVIRVRGGDLRYSGTDRKAVMRASPLPAVIAQSNGVASTSAQVDLYLAPAGPSNRAGVPSQVERMTASGHVVLTSQGRRGTGEELAYTSSTGNYVLTGTPSTPPRFTDPQRGSVTGTALIFNSRDDSVSIEGRGQQTITQTTVPR